MQISDTLCMKFTQILDILQAVLRLNDIKFLVLTGSTPVDIRQTLVDEFTEDETIPVFLLSTKAGGNVNFRLSFQLCSNNILIIGMGINLTAASAVIMYVLQFDFYPN